MSVPTMERGRARALRGVNKARRAVARRRAEGRLTGKVTADAKVQLGCGGHPFDGWLNIDINRAVRPDVRMDLRGGLPAPSSSVAFIFSEHVFKHLSLEDGCRLFADCHAALQAGGVLRIAMPDLRYIVERYMDGRYVGQGGPEAQEDPVYRGIDSAARLLNYALRSWGHVYLYDFDELSLRLRQAGFTEVVPRVMGESPHLELRGLEQRSESRLIVEATK